MGRPRDRAIDAAVLDATLSVLGDRGYGGFALDAVAAFAGTTTPAIRRRWPSRQRLIIDALAKVVVAAAVPDSGCTRCDLTDSVQLLISALHEQVPAGVLAALIADCAPDPQLHAHLVATLLQPTRQAVTATIARAVERGDLRAETDPELLADLLASVVYQRALFGYPTPTDTFGVGLVDQLLRGVAVDFAELVRISQAKLRHTHHHPGQPQHP